ncbi:unnamed protein product [Clonostachys rhizophaga]|uniref:Uncharacterized protein n=1 Tax=Clonostachys rhizophaga TaxID=160324 RepID=A0A9N9VYD7_9HYPO|nr:unnamed protein product [Clonostachys rhizophaga]
MCAFIFAVGPISSAYLSSVNLETCAAIQSNASSSYHDTSSVAETGCFSARFDMSAQFAFVPTDGSTMIHSPLRKLIRHHCMKGRNKLPNSRRARQTARKTRRAMKDKPECNRQRKIHPRPTTNNVSQARWRPEWPGAESCNQTAQQPAVPPPPPSDWALFRFPGELDAVSQELMHKYFVRNPIRDPICPFELFNLFIDFGQDPFQCFRALTGDMLCFRATLLLTSACEDLIIQRPLSGGTLTHLRLLLPILHSRLSDAASHQTDLILFAVGIMVSIAVLFGDQTAMAAHAVGLRQIIHLRGGFRALDHNHMVQFSLDRQVSHVNQGRQQWPQGTDLLQP